MVKDHAPELIETDYALYVTIIVDNFNAVGATDAKRIDAPAIVTEPEIVVAIVAEITEKAATVVGETETIKVMSHRRGCRHGK